MARARQSRAQDTAGGAMSAAARTVFEAAGPDFKAAGPDFEGARPDFEPIWARTFGKNSLHDGPLNVRAVANTFLSVRAVANMGEVTKRKPQLGKSDEDETNEAKL